MRERRCGPREAVAGRLERASERASGVGPPRRSGGRRRKEKICCLKEVGGASARLEEKQEEERTKEGREGKRERGQDWR